ncbi:MAG: hypothetical protein CSA19_00815 [Deltaproteobacteria bacterium]|nr:MAG: hypothetical protein CSA19_00815 [Deltaproteobacteria bacterium]
MTAASLASSAAMSESSAASSNNSAAARSQPPSVCASAARALKIATAEVIAAVSFPITLAAIAFYLENAKIPVKKLNAIGQQGKKTFTNIGCTDCHLSQMTTTDGIVFAPYTDLLLHDMGEGLADGRVEGSANERELRTAPLWGLSTYAKTLKSKKPYYLHDSRATSIEEAILWHGGEGEKSKQLFMKLPEKDRQAVLAFLNQL